MHTPRVTTTDEGAAGNRLRRRKERTRTALVRAAQRLIAEGRVNVPILEITQAADVGMGSFYNHFESKEQLAIEAFDYAYAAVERYFKEALRGTTAGLQRLRIYVDAFEGYCERPVVAGGCPIINACIEADDALPFLRERVTNALRAMRCVVRGNLQRAIERGEIAPSHDIEQEADFIVAALEGSVILARGMRSRAHSRRVAAALRAWIDGLD